MDEKCESMGYQPSVVIVVRPTRLQGLRNRWGTVGQAKFLLATAKAVETETQTLVADVNPSKGSSLNQPTEPSPVSLQTDFEDYESEDRIYQKSIARIESEVQELCAVKVMDRSYVPNFDFGMTTAVIVVGQDGLVANVAKYVGDVPIIAVNPDPTRIDGVLLPFTANNAAIAVRSVLSDRIQVRPVSLAEASLNDGQKILAFNDLYIGSASHVSARYEIEFCNRREPQSSSGIIVSTGAGSTGWISSVFNMTAALSQQTQQQFHKPHPLQWESRELQWVVREPFISKTSRAGLVYGKVQEGNELRLESLMPQNGVIFSDGIESDFLPFNSGTIVKIHVSKQVARLVINHQR